MQKLTYLLFSILFGNLFYAQEEKGLNLDFEKVERGLPRNWQTFGNGDYVLKADSVVKKNGKYAASIECTSAGNFKAWAFDLPANYGGKKITLSGWIKTENVNGAGNYAGLWMRIDPEVAFDNMHKRGVKGTTDWTKYEITLSMDPEKTKKIVVGGLLVGKGKMWLDDLKVTVDGKDISELQPYMRKLSGAEKDTEFDQGSHIIQITNSKENIENLKVLGFVWGFVKYYHPTIAKGDVNWDYELFRILPKIQQVKNKSERDALLLAWINKLGNFKEGKEKKFKPEETKLLPDLTWIEKSDFSPELHALILKVKNAERSDKNYYIDMYPGIGNPQFQNENAYARMKYPDAGFRLLALYRYWNMIQYFFPYRNLIEEDWKSILEEFIPKLAAAGNETEYTLAMLELIDHVHDSHASIWDNNDALNNFRGERYAPLQIDFIENKAVVTDYYNETFGKASGLQKGDVIVSVNKTATDEMVKNMLKYHPASNYPTQLRNIAGDLLRSNDSTLQVEFEHEGKTVKSLIKTYALKEINIFKKYDSKDTCFRMLEGGIALINNGSIKNSQLKAVWQEVEKSKALIIDIRNYPSDFVIYSLSNFMMPESKPFVKFSCGSVENPGYFSFTRELFAGRKNKNGYAGQVILLVNELTQSSAEFHAMAYRTHPNVKVLGSTTAGADGNVSQISLPGGITTMISGIGVYYPDGKETQRVGIVPDIVVKPTIDGIKKGKDEVLEKAVELLSK